MSIREKLKSLNLDLPVAARPLAAYVPAVKTGKLVFTAGQLPLVDGKIPYAGKVGKDVTEEEAKEMAKICALNAMAALNLVDDVDNVTKIVRIVCYVNGAPGFTNQPFVANGVVLENMNFWGLFINRDASAEQKQNALNCVNQAAAQPGHDEDFKRVGITTRRTVGAEKDKLLNDYIRVMKKYGL